jgi:hypothetical protein
MADNEPDDDLVDYDEEEVRIQNTQATICRSNCCVLLAAAARSWSFSARRTQYNSYERRSFCSIFINT